MFDWAKRAPIRGSSSQAMSSCSAFLTATYLFALPAGLAPCPCLQGSGSGLWSLRRARAVRLHESLAMRAARKQYRASGPETCWVTQRSRCR